LIVNLKININFDVNSVTLCFSKLLPIISVGISLLSLRIILASTITKLTRYS